MNLRTYQQMKLDLAEVLLSACRVTGDRDEDLIALEREGLSRLAGDHFTVVVVSRDGSGGTACANALIGRGWLPSDSPQLGSVPLRVRHGTRERVRVEYLEDGHFGDARLSDLAALVTEDGNPANVKRLRAVEVRLPGESLRRGLCLVVERAGPRERVVSGGDALVVVTRREEALSDNGLNYFEEVSEGFAGLFVAMNGNATGHGDGAAWRDEVETRLRAMERPPVRMAFPVALRRGLACLEAGDARGFRESGIPQLEGALASFLTQRGAEALLIATRECLQSVLARRPEAERNEYLRRLEAIEEAHRNPDPQEPLSALESTAEDMPPRNAGACAICVEVKEQGFRFLSRYQFELASNRDAREEHARAGGFCPRHTWQYERIASQRGVSSAYPVMLATAARRLRELARQGDGSPASSGPLLSARCPACAVQQETEERAIEAILMRALPSGEGLRGALPWVCLPHMERILLHPKAVSVRRLLLELVAVRLDRVAEAMRCCLLKDEGARRDLVSEEEREAAVRALGLVAGHEGTVCSREEPAVPARAPLEPSL